MNPATVRRIVALFIFVFIIVSFFIWKPRKPDPQPNVGKQEYKIRTYTLTEKDARKIQMLGRGNGFEGTISREPRTIKKFLGYIVTQDLAGSENSEKIQYVCEYLKSHGFEAKVIDKSIREKTVTIQVGAIYPTEADAGKTAAEVQRHVSVSFNVERYYKDVPYKSFIVVFSGIPDRDKALELKKKIEEVNAEVELVSY